jgi:hypothetical protein
LKLGIHREYIPLPYCSTVDIKNSVALGILHRPSQMYASYQGLQWIFGTPQQVEEAVHARYKVDDSIW